MNLQGRRIHIVGSADRFADEAKLVYIHKLVSSLVDALVAEGAHFVVPFGKEAFLDGRSDGPEVIWDWTVAEAVHRALLSGSAKASTANGRLVATVATSKSDTHIPAKRRGIYDEMRSADAVNMEFLEPGWSSGAVRRSRLAQLGDILIGISGGEGVEQLALEYSSKGKPVIPLDINVGASAKDGSGGAARLFRRALTEPSDFIRLVPGYSSPDLLDRLSTRDGAVEPTKVVAAVVQLLKALIPPRVFYVRLMNDKIPEYGGVEWFFRKVADPVVDRLGYQPLEMGRERVDTPWINQTIFDRLHHSSVALVDLTALRNNCFMELGYALGNMQRVVLCAKKGTVIPFDAFALEAFQWDESEDVVAAAERFRAHWARNIDTQRLVKPREAK